MSLSTTPKDISEHPTKGSIINPVDRAKKDTDVDHKICLFSIITAFHKGHMPLNQQINKMLQYMLNNSPVDVNQLSPEGKKLIQNTSPRQNADELLQQFIWHMCDIDIEEKKATVGSMKDGVPVPEGTRDDGQEAIKHLCTLLSLILTNYKVCKLLTDFSLISCDLLFHSLSKAAGSLTPSPDHLAHIDESAPNDQFITEGRCTARHNETPVLEAHVPGTDAYKLQEEAMICKEEGRERAAQEIDDIDDMGDVKEKGGVLWVILGIYYQSSIQWLLSFIKAYTAHTWNAGTHTSSHTSEHIIQDPQLCLTVAELCMILERFMNGQSMNVIFSAVERLAQGLGDDEELRAWFGGVDTDVLSMQV
ncbi:hypothetical protein BDQ17DRAFT_1336631 [Cyathus striatus]|nr:hypothetical protein BDQ17DRAFT_1336631 [Cyathus striatus]